MGVPHLLADPATRRSLLKEHMRRIRFCRRSAPAVEGPWQAGFTRAAVPATAWSDRFALDLFYPAPFDHACATAIRRATHRLLRPCCAPVIPQAPVATSPTPFPLVLYFPAWFSHGRENSFTLANLACHGFVVAALDDIVHLPLTSRRDRTLQRVELDMTSERGFRRTRDLAGRRMSLAGRLGSVVLDALQGSAWATVVDRDRIYALGFSFGGGVAASMSLHDARLKAVVNLDGSLFGDVARSGVSRPYLMIFGGDIFPTPHDLTQPDLTARFDAVLVADEVARRARDRHRNGQWTLHMRGARHLDFCDRLIWPAFADVRTVKEVDRSAMWAALNRELLDFFEDPRVGMRAFHGRRSCDLIHPVSFEAAA